MSWIVQNWRLKLLAAGLSLGLLAVVAFSENPPALKSIQAHVVYVGLQPGIVLITPPARIGVTLAGLTADLKSVGEQSATVRVDVSKIASAGNFTAPASTTALIPQISVQSAPSSIPIIADTQSPDGHIVPIEVQASNVAPGYTVTKAIATCGDQTNPCQLVVTGPDRIFKGLKAYVRINTPISSNVTDPSEPVVLEQDGKPLDLLKTYGTDLPAPGLSSKAVTGIVEVKRGQATKSVALRVAVSGRPACGYRILNLDVNQNADVVQVSGPTDLVQNVSETIPLAPIDVTGATGNVVVTQTVGVPAGVTAAPAQAVITITIDRQFDCTAPTPTPPVPTPTPTPSPR